MHLECIKLYYIQHRKAQKKHISALVFHLWGLDLEVHFWETGLSGFSWLIWYRSALPADLTYLKEFEEHVEQMWWYIDSVNGFSWGLGCEPGTWYGVGKTYWLCNYNSVQERAWPEQETKYKCGPVGCCLACTFKEVLKTNVGKYTKKKTTTYREILLF